MLPSVIGHSAPVLSFLDRFRSGRFPHAWLFEGPEGIGKSMAAQQLASVVLGSKADVKDGVFQVLPDDITQKMTSESHSDYRYVRRIPDENGKVPQFISVDIIRKMNHFFELKASEKGYRVAIVDSVDELNSNSANALLKTLEEPPERCLIILIHHGTSAILPTIRSRCVRLKFQPLSDEDIEKTLPEDERTEITRRLRPLSDGSPGRLKSYINADPEGALVALTSKVDANWPDLSPPLMASLQAQLTKSETHFALGIRGLDLLIEKLALTGDDCKVSAEAAKTWAAIKHAIARGEGLKLDLNERCAVCLMQLLKLSKITEIAA